MNNTVEINDNRAWVAQAVKEISAMKESLTLIKEEVDFINAPNWCNGGTIFSNERYMDAMETVDKMILIHNIFCPNEQIGMDFDEETDKWQLLPID